MNNEKPEFNNFYFEKMSHDKHHLIIKDPPIVKAIIKLMISGTLTYIALTNSRIAKYIIEVMKWI